MPEICEREGRCPECDNFHQPGERHHWRWWEVAPILMLAAITIGGWVWFLSGDHATATELARRVTSLEEVQKTQASDLIRVLQSQSRVEAMLEFIKENMAHH